MRVSATLAILAWCCSWGQAQEQRGSWVSSRPLPEKFLSWPFSPGEDWRITNSYDSNGHGNNIPFALDFQRAEGRAATSQSAVRAAAPGKVIAAVTTDRGGYGKYVVLDHGNGFATLYGHLTEVSVRPGAEVPALEKLGVAGNTGNSSGAHLHFEVRDIQGVQRWQDGKFVKPEPIMGQRDFAGATTGRTLPRTPDGKAGSYAYTLNDLDPSVRTVVADVDEHLKKLFGTEPPRHGSSSSTSRPLPPVPQPTPARPTFKTEAVDLRTALQVQFPAEVKQGDFQRADFVEYRWVRERQPGGSVTFQFSPNVAFEGTPNVLEQRRVRFRGR